MTTSPSSPAPALERPAVDAPVLPASTVVSRIGAGLHLLLEGGVAVSHLAGEVHASILRTPLRLFGWRGSVGTPLPYRLVGHGLGLLSRLTRLMWRADPAHPGHGPWHFVQGVANGVAGDTLERLENPLAHSMSLRDERGRAVDVMVWRTQARKGAVLFVHGLCLTEREWQSPEHHQFVEELRAQGLAVAWLRYNTGRPIHENGRELAEMLESGFGDKRAPAITLIGHSMGGLVIRSASHQAEQANRMWIRHLARAAYLGSPHQGAPLERLGHRANRLLALTPYSKPFMRLGNVRSRGIRDLRHGHVLPRDHEQGPLPSRLPGTARHLLLAAEINVSGKRSWWHEVIGDGLVPVRSALGQHLEPGKALHAPNMKRVTLAGLGHMALLSEQRVYAELRSWMAD